MPHKDCNEAMCQSPEAVPERCPRFTLKGYRLATSPTELLEEIVKCPKCKRPGVRQMLSVFVDCDADRSNLSKTGLRAGDVKVMGAGWPTALFYCPKCGWTERLKG